MLCADSIPLAHILPSYALHFTGQEMKLAYERFETGSKADDFSSLPDLHAASSGLKALCTWLTADGIEVGLIHFASC